jgi:hypothetical protein
MTKNARKIVFDILNDPSKETPCDFSDANMSNEDRVRVRRAALRLKNMGYLRDSVSSSPEAICDAIAQIKFPMEVWKSVALFGLAIPGLFVGGRKTSPGQRSNTALTQTTNRLLQLGQAQAQARGPSRICFRVPQRIRNFQTNENVLGCVNSYKEAARTAHGHVRNVLRENPDLTASADPLGIQPGSHIYTKGAFKVPFLSHHGVYIGNGMVVDVGSIPTACMPNEVKAKMSSKMKGTLAFKGQGIGIRTMEEFMENPKKTLYHVVYLNKNPRNPAHILRDAVQAIGPNKYDVFRDNCEHLATQIVSGVRRSTQVQGLLAAAVTIPIILTVAARRRRRNREI